MPSSPAPGLSIRRAKTTDAGAVAALMITVDRSFGLDPWVTEADISEDLTDPELDVANNTWVVEEGSEIVGYGEIWSGNDEGVAMETQGWVAPGCRGRGIGTYLIDSTEEAAREYAARRTERPVLLRNFIPSVDSAAASMLKERGYEVVRHFFHMAIDLADVGEPPPPPDGVTIRALDPVRDARPLYELIEHAFSEHWNWTPMTFEAFWRRVGEREDFDPEISLIAMRGDVYVGASWNVTKIDRGWVQDLAVHESARRMGLGESLLRHTFKVFKDKGWSKVGLGLDAGNVTGALRLYQRVGMHVTRQFDAYEKDVSVGPVESVSTAGR